MSGAIIGTLLGLASAGIALILAGAGHGWCSASIFGLLSLVLSPLAFARLGLGRNAQALTSRDLLLMAGLLDLFLLLLTLYEGTGYFMRVWRDALIWLVLWSAWQWATLASWLLTRHSQLTGQQEQPAAVRTTGANP
ncbi:MAG: hypothetical protein ACOZE7_18855 [Pseudomonadota bacterium]